MIDCVIYQHEFYVTAFKSEIVLLQDKFVVVPSAVEMRLFESADRHVNRNLVKIVSQSDVLDCKIVIFVHATPFSPAPTKK